MKTLLYISLLTCLGFRFADKDCGLGNGKYKVVYDEQFSDSPKFEFVVKGKTLTQINSSQKEVYLIKKLSEKSFQLIPTQKRADTLTELQKALISHGQPYYELKNCKKDTVEFIMRVNLHVISHSGKFVKIE
ncbi:hypothetical protein [Pontibacter rugosus]|uniref:PepSY-like beta-lactamase-inhibitor n=1 Tax=Pontibacter rugosus TaxID=1745966 RepID=A0ABW3SNK5_9BACT